MTDSTIALYNKIAQDYARSFQEKPEERAIILEFIQSLSPHPKILDIGCGNSDYFYLFDENGVNYTGIDLSEEMIKIARNAHPQGKFLIQDMCEVDFPDNSFDGVYCFYSLIHISDREIPQVLKKIQQVSKSKARLLLSVQEGEGEVYKKSPFSDDGKLYLNLFTESKISRLLNDAGFRVEKVQRRKVNSEGELPYSKMMILASKFSPL